jgi:excisionase family DNA binding protein
MSGYNYIYYNVSISRKEKTVSDVLLTAKELAKYLDLSLAQIYTLNSKGKLPSVKIGRSVRYPLKELEAWIASNTRKPREQ